MKSLPFFIVAASSLFALSACNQAETANSSANNSAAENVTEANAVEAVDDNANSEAGLNSVDGKPAADATAVDANILADKPAAPADDQGGEKPSN